MTQLDCNVRKSFICIDEAITSDRLATTTTSTTASMTTTTTVTTVTTQTSVIQPIRTPQVPDIRPTIPPPVTSSLRGTSTTSTTTSPTITTTATTRRPVKWSVQCGPFWEEDPNTHFCYQFNDIQLTWMQARLSCSRRRGDLLSISSIQEQYYIAGRIRNMVSSALWIGANSRAEDKGWQWSDGSPFNYLNFRAGEPDNNQGVEDCVYMIVKTTKWVDTSCNRRYGYVCKKIGNVVPTQAPYVTPPVIPDGKMYGCPERWIEYHSQCFKVIREKKTWLEARSLCRENGGDLASIVDENEHNFVLSQLPKSHCYNMYHNDEKCDNWAKQGECTINPVWMATHCHLSCSICIHDCKNLHNDAQCYMWANNGECDKNPKWMLANCPLSCGICDGARYGGFWIGLNDRLMKNSFSWTNGDSVTYTLWSKGEPNNYGTRGEDCVIMKLQGGEWNDADCDSNMPGFICKRKKDILPIPSEAPVPDGCPEGAYAYDALCYSLFTNASQWIDAERHCTSMNGHLATVNDRYVQAFLASLISDMTSNVWIGLTDTNNPGSFETWSSGTTLKFTHWFSSHTGNENGTCVSMKSDIPVGLWVIANCTANKQYICEFPRTGYTTSTTTVLPTTTTEPPKCYDGWTEFDNYCYKAYKNKEDKKPWLMARQTCRDIGADLISLHSIAEESFMISTFMGHWSAFWIGMNDRDLESGYQWSDGSIVDYTNWESSEPNDSYGVEDCAEITGWGQSWNDNNCFAAKEFVCKVKKGMPVKAPDVLSTPKPAHCGTDSDWIFYKEFCYYFKSAGTDESDAKTWYEASRFCKDNGGYLTSIHDQDTNNFILSVTSKQPTNTAAWIGLNDLEYGGYKWSDSTPTDFVAWHPGEPNDSLGGQKCVMLNALQGRWYDENCNKKLYGFICRKENGTSDPITTYKTPIAPGGCPPRFIASPFNSKCYLFGGVDPDNDDDPLSWFAAYRQCTLFGSGFALLTIEDDIEHAFLISQMRNFSQAFWIGLHDQVDNSEYMWQDNSEVKISKWANGEPNGYDENCVEMYPAKNTEPGMWNDVSCWNIRSFICQGRRGILYNTPPSSTGCSPGYIKYESNCYKVQTEDKTFDAAQALCQNENGNLVSINDIAEQSFIKVVTASIEKPVWIGLSRDTVSKRFSWIDGWPLLFTSWDLEKDEPSNGADENCVASVEQMWADTTCDQLFSSVCKISSVVAPTLPPKHLCSDNGYPFENMCYVFVSRKMKYTGARKDCKKRGMDLVSIHSERELKHVMFVARQGSRTEVPKAWIGLTKLQELTGANDGEYHWTDETSHDFDNWADGEPSESWDDVLEECTEIYPHGRWNDINCRQNNRAFVCKGPQVSMTTAQSETTALVETTETQQTTELVETTIETGNQTNATFSKILTAKTTRFPSVILPRSQSIRGGNFDTGGKTTGLTAGQIIGILIGVIAAGIIICAVLFVYRNLRPTGTYNTDQGFSNALYLKSMDTVSVADNVSISSRTKICPS